MHSSLRDTIIKGDHTAGYTCIYSETFVLLICQTAMLNTDLLFDHLCCVLLCFKQNNLLREPKFIRSFWYLTLFIPFNRYIGKQ